VTASGPPAPDVLLADPQGRWVALGVLATAMALAMTTWFSASAVIPNCA